MKRAVLNLCVAALLAGSGTLYAQDIPELPKPQKEHEWLKQLEGEWTSKSETVPAPGEEAIVATGTEKVRSLGGFFTIGEAESDMMGFKVNSIMTLGYDPMTKKYVGTWVDSCMGYLWKYEGTLDESGKTLVLDTEGPDMQNPGKLAKYRETITFESKDHRTFTSSVQGENGQYVTFVKAEYHRVK